MLVYGVTGAGKSTCAQRLGLWTSPHRYRYLVDHEGTADVSHDRAARRAEPPEH